MATLFFNGNALLLKKILLSKDENLKLEVVEIKLKFISTISIELANAAAGRSSPDMTHYYTIKEGDTSYNF